MIKETIMICLNTLGIGGIETATLNQTISLIKKGYRVIILAKNGIYKEKFCKAGAICIDFEYTDEIYFNYEKTNKILEIIKQYNVTQIHVEQIYCVNSILPALLISKIKYIAYLHNGKKGDYDWFIKTYEAFDKILKIYFENAYKIISITESSKKENMELFNISEDKYKIIKNSIDFNNINNRIKQIRKIDKNKISKYILISRLDNDKKDSVINGIDLFKKIQEKNKNAKLKIAGDGICISEIKEYCADLKDNIEFLGKRNDIIELINENDCVLGLGRCLIEGIAVKKLCIVCGYEKKYILIKPENIKKVSDNNFTEREQQGKNVDEIILEINELKNQEINQIINTNYNYIYENLNIDKNIFVIPSNDLNENNFNIKTITEYIMELQNINKNLKNENKKVFEEGQKVIKWHLNIIEKNNEEIKRLNAIIQNNSIEIENLNKKFIKKFISKIKSIIKNKLKIRNI